jgi:hypothetical protein
MSTNEIAGLTATITKSGTDGAGNESSRRRSRRSVIRRAAISAVGLAGVAGVMLAGPSVASATVNQTTSPWASPSSPNGGQVTAVYSLQNLAEPGNTMLEDNDIDSGNGALTNVWQAGPAQYQDPMANGAYSSDPQILAANHLWEFVPQASNTGGTLLTGYGELVNRQSGLCLDVNGSDPNEYGDGATVDQWTCGGGPNQAWQAYGYAGGGYLLVSELDYGKLGVGNSTCNPQGNGDQVYLRTGVTTCDEWNIQQASYSFGTDQVSVPLWSLGTMDVSGYSCIPGYNLRLNQIQVEGSDPQSGGNPGSEYYYDYDNISQGNVSVYIGWYEGVSSWAEENPDGTTTNPNTVQAGTVGYQNPSTAGNPDGQLILYCDPPSSNP